MMIRWCCAVAVVVAFCQVSAADVVVLNETFEQYGDDGALFGAWGSGNGSNFRLADDSNNPDAFPTGGKGAEHIGGTVAEFINLNGGVALKPTATQSIVIQGEVYDTGTGNKRMSIGLRGPSANLVEMGQYNTNSCDPTLCGPNQAGGTSAPQNAVVGDPGFYTGTGYGARLQLFQSATAPLLVQPDWQYFQLPIELDRTTDLDEIVNIGDVGPGWHQYKATITPGSVKLEIDLFRDGLRNTSRVPDTETGIRPGTPGVDAVMEFPVVATSAGFNSLRIGGPSGVASTGGGLVYDNIKLSLVDIVAANNADFNSSGTVDAADYTIWRDHMGLTGAGTRATGDANGDTNVNSTDYDLWKSTFGTSPGAGAVAAAVPEPTSAALGLISVAFAAVAGVRRRS